MPIVLETDSDIVRNATNIKEAVADPVSPLNHRMPPNGDELSAEQIDMIVQWWGLGGVTTVSPINDP